MKSSTENIDETGYKTLDTDNYASPLDPSVSMSRVFVIVVLFVCHNVTNQLYAF